MILTYVFAFIGYFAVGIGVTIYLEYKITSTTEANGCLDEYDVFPPWWILLWPISSMVLYGQLVVGRRKAH